MDTPPSRCWLHPSVEVRDSAIEGRGLFATALISAGAVVSRLGGSVVSQQHLDDLMAARARDSTLPYIDTITFDDGSHLVLGPGEPNHFGNHSCDPNLWWTDAITLVARRDIAAGEEVTNDYGTSSGDPKFSMDCRCGSARCRGIVTGDDWRRAELRARYGDHWVPALLKRIGASRD